MKAILSILKKITGEPAVNSGTGGAKENKPPLADILLPHLPAVILLLTATWTVYGQIIGHEFLSNWDDNLYVVENPAIRNISLGNIRILFSNYYVGNYAPVQMLSYMLDYRLWGLNASGFLATNLVIHSLNGLLFYRLLWRLYQKRFLAAFAASVFLLHPVQVESVAWISQRKNLLSMLFFLFAWLCYSRYRETSTGSKLTAYAAAVATFIAALLAKSIAVVFPLILFLYDFCFPVNGRRFRFMDKLPFVIVAGAVAAMAMYTQLPDTSGGGGREAMFHGGTALTTLFTMLPVFCRYLEMIVWPFYLSADYNPPIHLTADSAVIGAAFILVATAAATTLMARIDRRAGFWAAIFAAGLLPVSQIVPLVTLMNDRYLYFPLLGVAALAGVGAEFLRDRIGGLHRGLPYLLLSLPLFLMISLTYQRTTVWQSALTLWSDAVAKDPGNSRAQSNLGEAYFKEDMVLEAKSAFQNALEFNPANMNALNGLASIYITEGDTERAEQLLKTLLSIAPVNSPALVKGLGSMGNIHLLRGEYNEAEKLYNTALAKDPDNVNLLMLLGSLAVVRQDLEKARQIYGRAENISRDNAEVAFQMACIASLAGEAEQSLSWLEKSLQRGYQNLSQLLTNDELSAVRTKPAYDQLLRRYFPDIKPAN